MRAPTNEPAQTWSATPIELHATEQSTTALQDPHADVILGRTLLERGVSIARWHVGQPVFWVALLMVCCGVVVPLLMSK